MTRFCDAFRCESTVQSGRFLCPNHWRMVPVATQRSINARYRACKVNSGFLSDLVYLQACVDAIDGIAQTEFGAGHQAGQGSYHRLLAMTKRRVAA